MNRRADALAGRIEQGARALLSFAETLSDADWNKAVAGDGRKVGVIVHHVASVYPVEVDLALRLAAGNAITGVGGSDIVKMNAKHASDHPAPGRAETLALLRDNSKTAAARVRRLTDEELDRAAPVSLYADAPLTTQFFIEDHALRHSFHHLARIRAALGR